MNLPKYNFSKIKDPLRILLLGNEATWKTILAVISDLSSEQLAYKHPKYAQRSIAEMILHAMDAQYAFFTRHLLMGEKYTSFKKVPKTTKAAEKAIVKIYKSIVRDWKRFTQKDLKKKFKTDWGAALTGEIALFESITHTYYHISEICSLRGLGGFPTKAMG